MLSTIWKGKEIEKGLAKKKVQGLRDEIPEEMKDEQFQLSISTVFCF